MCVLNTILDINLDMGARQHRPASIEVAFLLLPFESTPTSRRVRWHGRDFHMIPGLSALCFVYAKLLHAKYYQPRPCRPGKGYAQLLGRL